MDMLTVGKKPCSSIFFFLFFVFSDQCRILYSVVYFILCPSKVEEMDTLVDLFFVFLEDKLKGNILTYENMPKIGTR